MATKERKKHNIFIFSEVTTSHLTPCLFGLQLYGTEVLTHTRQGSLASHWSDLVIPRPSLVRADVTPDEGVRGGKLWSISMFWFPVYTSSLPTVYGHFKFNIQKLQHEFINPKNILDRVTIMCSIIPLL